MKQVRVVAIGYKPGKAVFTAPTVENRQLVGREKLQKFGSKVVELQFDGAVVATLHIGADGTFVQRLLDALRDDEVIETPSSKERKKFTTPPSCVWSIWMNHM